LEARCFQIAPEDAHDFWFVINDQDSLAHLAVAGRLGIRESEKQGILA
jgi:hypothetical protein